MFRVKQFRVRSRSKTFKSLSGNEIRDEEGQKLFRYGASDQMTFQLSTLTEDSSGMDNLYSDFDDALGDLIGSFMSVYPST